MPVDFKFRAFLSYSHADSSTAKWLHGRLEGFTIDKEIVGRSTATGAIPKSLRPVFRDRHDFDAGSSLTEQTLVALSASAALVVLCSPASAKSHAVNEEVRLFKWRHPERPVIPVILDGKPGDALLECFPAALRFEVESDGALSDRPVTLLAADVRESGDGRELAVSKVVARLLGLPPDDVYRRAERERQRKGRIRNGVIAVLAMLLVAASGSAVYAWHLLKTNEAFLGAMLDRATDIVNTAVAQAEKYNVPRSATLELLHRAEGLFDDMARLGRPTPALQRQKAHMLIEFGRNYRILGDTSKERERIEEARRISSALAADGDLDDLRSLSVALTELGKVQEAQGDIPAALASSKSALEISKRLVEADPEHLEWQRDFTISQNRMGSILYAQGDMAGALEQYRAALEIREGLAKTDPGATAKEVDVSVSYELVGDVLLNQGKLDAALESFRAALSIKERLAKLDGKNSALSRNLSVGYNKVGDVLFDQGKIDAALENFQSSFRIVERLVKSDEGNTGWQGDLAVALEYIGSAHAEKNELQRALESYNACLAIRLKLAKIDPKNLAWQRALAVAEEKVGDILRRQDDLAGALAHYTSAFETISRIAKADPANAVWQRDLSVAHGKVGRVLLMQGDTQGALEQFKSALAISERQNKADPALAQWQSDVAANYGMLGRIQVKLDNKQEALRLFKLGRDMVAPIAKRSGNQQWLGFLKSFDNDIEDLEPGWDIVLATRAIEENARDPEAHVARAKLHASKQDFDKAIADYTKAIELGPRNAVWLGERAKSYNARANVAGSLADLDQAIADYTEALALEPMSASSFFGRADSYSLKGEAELSIVDLLKATELAPDNRDYVRALGVARFGTGDFKGAARDLARAFEIRKDRYSLLYLYLASRRSGEDAEREFEAKAAVLKDTIWPHAIVEFFLGKRSSAAVLEVAEDDDERCEAHFYIGQWHIIKGDAAPARTELQIAADTCPKDFLEYKSAVAELARLKP